MTEEPEACCITLVIVGAIRSKEQLAVIPDLLQRVERALADLVPDFLPGKPAVHVQVFEVRDDWIRRSGHEST